MCSIIVVNNHYKQFPLVIAANREEQHTRRSAPPQIFAREPHLVFGPKDIEKGGTWLGVNKQSMFVGLTNQGEKTKKKTSRGHIVLEGLKCESIDKLLSFVEDIDPSQFDGFNLVFGNAKSMYVAHSYLLHSMVVRELQPGVSIITNDMTFKGSNLVSHVHKKLDPIVDMPWVDYYGTLKNLLAGSKYGLNKKVRTNDDGVQVGKCTVSSSILAFSNDGLARFKYYDRMNKVKTKDGEPYHRYKDYIDLWRSDGGMNTNDTASEEEPKNENAAEPEAEVGIYPFDVSEDIDYVAKTMRKLLSAEPGLFKIPSQIDISNIRRGR